MAYKITRTVVIDGKQELSVYRSLNAQNSNQTYELLLSWVEDISKQAQDNLGIELECSNEVENVLMNKTKYDSDAPLSDQYMYYLRTNLYHNDAVLTLSCVSEGNVTSYDLDGIVSLYEAVAHEPFPALVDPTDEELSAAARPVVTFVNNLTGKNYALDTYRVLPELLYMSILCPLAYFMGAVCVFSLVSLTADIFVPSYSLRMAFSIIGAGIMLAFFYFVLVVYLDIPSGLWANHGWFWMAHNPYVFLLPGACLFFGMNRRS